jgi:hypothetical protein
MAAACILPAYGVQCYGDIGFQSFTSSLFLGVVMAVAGKVAGWGDAAARDARRSESVPAIATAPPLRDASWPPTPRRII